MEAVNSIVSKSFADCVLTKGGVLVNTQSAPRFCFDVLVYKDKRALWNNDPMRHDVSWNLVTNEGKNALNNIMFHAATQITTWYIELFESNTTPVVGMTYAVPTYTPCTAYSEAVRQEYVEGASSSQSITNTSSRANFTMNASKSVYGASLVGGGSAATTKGNTAGGGTLYCVDLFTSMQSVVSGNVLAIGITITQS